MSADSSASAPASTPAAVAPVPERAAIAILGSMIFLIIALAAVLVLTTWAGPAAAAEGSAADAGYLVVH